MLECMSTNAFSKKRPRVLMLADAAKPEIQQRAAELRPVLEKYVEVVAVVDDFSAGLPSVEVDFSVVLGGDGSMLRAAHAMEYQQLPVLGVNLGRLGFLADVQPEQLDELLPQVVAGEYRVVSHLMFECEVLRKEKPLLRVLGLNEVAVLAGPPFAMLDVQLYVDGELATTYSCDVSTPVGSTAHSLSAGGPILRKNLQAFVISPISPHTLTNRPVIDSADRVYELAVPQPNEGTSLVIDGKVVCQLTVEDRIRVTRSEAQFQLIEVHGHGYYRTLREKLGWGGRLKLES
ncbi:MAG: NAD(+)/NADH kinase [Planctomycetes bacterium]|nr:NAD(+)/NADH kinase [Planctomycetota bacterium]